MPIAEFPGTFGEAKTMWLFRAAHNHVTGALRQHARRERIARRHIEPLASTLTDAPDTVLDGDLRDDMVRMLFVCCDEAIAAESRALKTLCGFEAREIAQRLFLTEANAYKRLARALKAAP